MSEPGPARSAARQLRGRRGARGATARDGHPAAVIHHVRIAEAQLRGRPRQAAIALASVAVGSAMLIVTLSLTTGLSEDFVRKTTESAAHVEVLPRRPAGLAPRGAARARRGGVRAVAPPRPGREAGGARAWPRVTSALAALPGVRVVTPAVDAQVVLLYGTVRRPAALAGVDPELRDRALDGAAEGGPRAPGATSRRPPTASSSAARSRARSASRSAPTCRPWAAPAAPCRCGSSASWRSGLSRVDKTLAMVNLPLAQALAGLPTDQATTVRLALDDPLRAPDVARRAEARTGYVCRSWQERSAASVDAFERQNRITLVLVFFTDAGGGVRGRQRAGAARLRQAARHRDHARRRVRPARHRRDLPPPGDPARPARRRRSAGWSARC